MKRDKKQVRGFQEWQPAFARFHIRTVGNPDATKHSETYQESVCNMQCLCCCIVTVLSSPSWCHFRHRIVAVLSSLLWCRLCICHGFIVAVVVSPSCRLQFCRCHRSVAFVVALSRFRHCCGVAFIVALSRCRRHGFVVAIVVLPSLSHCRGVVVTVVLLWCLCCCI